jgi:hypothetical protein
MVTLLETRGMMPNFAGVEKFFIQDIRFGWPILVSSNSPRAKS